MNEDIIIRAYEKYQTMRSVAGSLGISVWKVHDVLKRHGVPVRPGKEKGDRYIARGWGCVAKWIRAHPRDKLPQGRWEISKKTGCSLKAVDTYISRRRKAAINLPKQLPDLSKRHIVLRSTHQDKEIYFASPTLGEYRVEIHPVSFMVFINGVLRTGEPIHVEIPLEEMWRRLKEEGTTAYAGLDKRGAY